MPGTLTRKKSCFWAIPASTACCTAVRSPSANTFAENGLSHSVALNKAIIDLGTGKLLTIPQAVGIRKPDIMLVAFGINGVAYMGKPAL